MSTLAEFLRDDVVKFTTGGLPLLSVSMCMALG